MTERVYRVLTSIGFSQISEMMNKRTLLKNKHGMFNRRSIRLKDHDYRGPGLYFITILCHNRAHLFGVISDKRMVLNEAGEEARKCWMDIPNHFHHAILHEFIIMPDHIHGIIELTDSKPKFSGLPDLSPLYSGPDRPHGTSMTIGSIVRGFKLGVVKWMRKHTDIKRVWHRNYYEHIIRTEADYIRISQYIRNNPKKWEDKQKGHNKRMGERQDESQDETMGESKAGSM